MFKINHLSFFITLYLRFHHSHQYYILDEVSYEEGNHFDILVFTQKWPVTYCKDWVLNKGHGCVFPEKKNQWTVHGIWPTKVDREMIEGGYDPEYCNDSWAFDPKQIRSIESDLDQAWTNIYKESTHYSLWEHEWSRHGTCAAVLKPFSTQLKIFSKGVEFNRKFSLLDMLNAAHIFPSDTKQYTPQDFIDAVKAKTKKNPTVVCHKFDHKNKHEVPSIWELRICLDKKFNSVDCYPVIDKETCSSSKILFPAKV